MGFLPTCKIIYITKFNKMPTNPQSLPTNPQKYFYSTDGKNKKRPDVRIIWIYRKNIYQVELSDQLHFETGYIVDFMIGKKIQGWYGSFQR